MPNPEAIKSNPEPATGEAANTTTGEKTGETPRQVNQERGEKTIKAEHEQREKDILEEIEETKKNIAEIEARMAARQAKIDELKRELGNTPPSEQEQPTQTTQGEGNTQTSSEQGQTQTPTETITPTNENPEPVQGESTTLQQSENTPSQGESAAAATAAAAAANKSGEATNSGETQPSPEEIQNTINEAKKHPKLKKFLTGATATLLAALTIFGVGNLFFKKDKDNNKNVEPDRPGYTYNIDYGVGEDKETEGIYDGYGEKGMWLSENKGTPYDFASAGEVAEVCDDDECEMIKYTARNQVESYADYLANMPEALQPEGFKGLTILETEKKLESLSDDEFEAIQEKFEKGIDGAFTRDVTLNGQYHNSYMRLIDPSKPATHENMELVECVTQENGVNAKEFFWTDDGTANGNIIGSMTVKIIQGKNGIRGCMQIVNRIDSNTQLYDGMEKIAQRSETTDSDTTDTEKHETTDSDITTDSEEEIIKPKDSENLIRIDDQIHEDIANDIGSGEVHVTPNPGVSDDEKTEKPSAEYYQGTEPEIVQNDSADIATPVQELISPENNYSEDLGGAHSDEYAPVQEDNAAQEEADANERNSEDTPHASDSGSFSIEDLLNLP